MPTIKRKYLINETEFYAIDSLDEFKSLFKKFNNADKISKTLHSIVSKITSEKDLKVVEETIKNHIIYNNNGGMYKENNKTYLAHNIISYKMPKDLEKAIYDLANQLNKQSNNSPEINKEVSGLEK